MATSHQLMAMLNKLGSLFGMSEYNHDASDTGEDAAWRSKVTGGLEPTDNGKKGFVEALAKKNRYKPTKDRDLAVAYEQLSDGKDT